MNRRNTHHMEGIHHPIVRTVEEVFSDFRGRRAGLLKALTTDLEEFYTECDPVKENLCLYGFPNETWKLSLPAEEVPPELPEPSLGINFARDGIAGKEWVSLVAVHSDSWLLSVAFYFGARFGFGKDERKRLFQMINDLPTIFDIVSGKVKQSKDRSANHNGNKSKSGSKSQRSESQKRASKMASSPNEEDSREEEEEEEGAICGACGHNYAADEFWIFCEACERWFHGNCVKVTPSMADRIDHYKCPACSSDKLPRT